MKPILSKLVYSLCLITCISSTASSAPGDNEPRPKKIASISKNDEKNIKLKAEGAVKRFMQLLNTIATGLDLDMAQTEQLIRNSYSPVDTQIFYDSAVIVEDDIRKTDDPKLSKQKPAYSYLRDFEIFYKKTDSSTVHFSNFRLSNVKQGKFLYIKVSYDHLFEGQSKISNERYSTQKRVAELRVEKIKNKWKAWVVDVHYEDSADLATASLQDIPVVDDTQPADSLVLDKDPEAALLVSRSVVTDPLERDRLRRRNDSLRTYMAYRVLIDSGKHALNTGQYIIAYQFFNEAETVVNGSDAIIRHNDRDFLETMISETKRNIELSHRTPEQYFQGYLQQALLKKNQRKYEQAVDNYNKALSIKPADDEVKAKIKTLTIAINNLARLDAKYQAGNYKDAIKEYDKAIAGDPSNSDYYVGRGKCFDKTKDLKKALLDYNKAIELDQNNIEAYQAKALLHEKQKSFPEAVAAFTVCTSIDKTDITAYVKIADLNLQKGNAAAAMNIIDKGIENNPQASVLYFRRGNLLQSQKQSRQAIQAFSSAIMYDSINARIYFQRGLCNIDIKDVSSAGDDFAAARRLGLDQESNQQTLAFANEFFNAGMAQLASARLDNALALFANARLIDPSFAGYHYQTGYVNFHMRRYDEAIENFSDAVQLDARYASAYQMRALSNFRKGKYNDCIPDLKKAIELDPKVAENYKYYGDVLIRMKDYTRAISSYNQSLDANKSRKHDLDDSLKADLYFGKGYAYLYTGDFKHALQYFGQSIKIDKKVPQVHYYRGVTYLKQKEYSDATESIEKALTLDPTQPAWNTTMGEIYYQKGKYDKALPLFRKAITDDTASGISPDAYYLRANTYFRINDFQAALNDYRVILAAGYDKKYPEFNTSIGHSFLHLEQPDSAMVYFNRENLKGLNPMSLYGTAIVYVMKAQPDQAFKYLDKTMTAGKVPKSMITNDKRLLPIRNDKRYRAIIKRYY